MESLPRRTFLSTLAGVALLSGTTAALAGNEASACVPGALPRGSRFGRWTIVDVNPHAGALLVEVKGEGAPFTLEILARDDGPDAVLPPAKTKHLAVFVRNGGNGNDATDEDHGLAAITLAARLEKAGDAEIKKGLLTHRERLVHPEMRR